MVHASVTAVLAELADDAEFAFDCDEENSRTADRFAGRIREQSSRVRFASQARHSRKRSAKSQAPAGPRRRLYKG